MAVKIRLKRMGKIREPHYRIIVADSRTKRDGRVLEEIGKYHPKEDPSLIEVNSERVQYWLGVGAQPSEPVAAILKVTGDWQQFKGEPAPEPMKVPQVARNRTDAFNEALKDAHHEPAEGAVTSKESTAKTRPATEKPAESQPATSQSDAEDAAANTSANAEPESTPTTQSASTDAEAAADEAADGGSPNAGSDDSSNA